MLALHGRLVPFRISYMWYNYTIYIYPTSSTSTVVSDRDIWWTYPLRFELRMIYYEWCQKCNFTYVVLNVTIFVIDVESLNENDWWGLDNQRWHKMCTIWHRTMSSQCLHSFVSFCLWSSNEWPTYNALQSTKDYNTIHVIIWECQTN